MTKKEIRMLRHYHAMSQKKFAESIGVGESTIAKIESGYSEVSEKVRSRILRKYDVSQPEFITFCDRMNKPII